MADKILNDAIVKDLKTSFEQLDSEVTVSVFTKKGENDQYNELTRQLITEIAEVDNRIKPEFHEVGGEESERLGVHSSPTLLICPDKYRIMLRGAPLGEEGRTLIMAMIMASNGRGAIREPSVKKLQRLEDRRLVKVFVSPTWPYCPQQSLYAIAAAVERPDLVSVEIIEINENKEMAREYGAMSVPRTFINETLTADGLEAEEMFMESLLLGKKSYRITDEEGAEPTKKVFDAIILGAGPAGLTAAIYARRSGLSTVVLESATIGGQISLTPAVENYPGFPNIAGNTLVELMAKQTLEYVDVHEGTPVENIVNEDGVFRLETSRGEFKSRAVIIATGASHRTLGAKGEERLSGRGVSYCATCDGYQFKDGGRVVVVGGGNSAATDALYLDSIGSEVTLVHRGDKLRTENKLQESLKERGVEVRFNTVVSEIKGTAIVESVTLKNKKTGKTEQKTTDGVFIAIGYDPNAEVARLLGAEIDHEGYIKTDTRQKTTVKGVYAAGDVTGGVKQITVAVGQGSVAAITAFEDITNNLLHRPL